MDAKAWIGALILGAIIGGIYELWKAWRYPKVITDENGERQRVIAWNRGEPVYNPKTWQQRVFEEVEYTKKRRKKLREAAIVLAVVLGIAIWIGPQLGAAFLVFAVFTIGVPFVLYLLPPLLEEVRYQTGDQSIEGAKVLDKKPGPRPGKEVVETQKAHGDARLASEAEALSLLNSKK